MMSSLVCPSRVVIPSCAASQRGARLGSMRSRTRTWIEALYCTNVILMERIDGRTLEALLQEGPLLPERARTLAAEVALCLHAAHQVGVAHGGLRASEGMLVSGVLRRER